MQYEGFAFRQNSKSPVQVSLVVPSSQIDQWARVPTRLSSRPRGFQRASVKGHVTEIRRFFLEDKTNTNASPTSVLLGLSPESRTLVSLIDPIDESKIDPDDITSTPRRCNVNLTFDPWLSLENESTVDELCRIAAEVMPSLKSAKLESDEEFDEEEMAENDSDIESRDEESTETDYGSESDNDESDSENSPLNQNITQIHELDSNAADELHLRSIDDLVRIIDQREYLDWNEDEMQRLIDVLKEERKPGLIIDGQHRIQATKSLEEIPFIVSFLPFADWPELAFQFIVNNSSAKKVDDNLLFAIVGQSLEPEELTPIESRLNRSGIKVSLIKASMRVHLEDNPFSGMLKTNTPGDRGFLDATAMQKKVIELWYGTRGRTGTNATLKKFRAITDDPGASKEYRIIDLFGANCSGNSQQEKSEEWQSDLWFNYFTEFWNAVRNRYASEGLWPNSTDAWPPAGQVKPTPDQKKVQNLMGATILGMLQVAVLQRWADRREDRAREDDDDYRTLTISPSEFGKQISKLLEPVTADFFTSYIRSGADASKLVKQTFIRALTDVLRTQKSVAEVKKSYQASFRE